MEQTYKFLTWAVTAVIGPFAVWVVNAISNLRATDKGQEVRIQYAEKSIENIWSNQIMNAQLKIAQRRPDLGEINSPFAITQDARALFDRHGFTARLHDYYLRSGKNKTPVQQEMEIAELFRTEFMATICMEQHFSDMECIALAAEIAREAVPLNLSKMDSDRPQDTRLGK